MTDFEAAIRAHGLLPRGPVVADGQWHRCGTEDRPKTRNGAYKLALDGGVGFFQNHALDDGVIVWKPDGGSSGAEPRQVDWEAIRQKRRARREEERRRIQAAREFYAACAPLRGGHPYLEAHGLGMNGCDGLKIDRDGWMVIPALRRGSLISLQRIAPDGEKRFWYGAPFSGVSYTVDRPGASITVLCEGLATGLSIFAAAPLTRIVVAFTASNMVKIAESFGGSGMVTVAADNDTRTICNPHRREGATEPFTPWEERPEWCRCNPGRCAAEEAARALGCGYMLPMGMDGSDWCDWREQRTAERMEHRPYGSHQTDAMIRRSVDAEIAIEVQRRAKFLIRKATA